MEQQLLAASLRSRQDHDLIRSYVNVKATTYSKIFQILMSKVGDYYTRDHEAQVVVPDVLLAQIAEVIRNDKHVQRLRDMVAESLATDASAANVRAIILLAKQQEVGDKLSQALATDGGGRIDALLDELKGLRAMTSLEDLSGPTGLEVYKNIDLKALIAKEFDPDSLIQLLPLSLNERIDGGAKRGHHVLVFAPVEAGKTCTVVNMNCGFARAGKRSLYFINEDRPQDITLRHISNLSGMTKYQIYEDTDKAQELAIKNGWENIIIVDAKPGTPEQIEDCINEHEPDACVVDQLRNLAMKADNRVNQLEAAATAVRNIGKRTNTLMVSVTQAGDSATGKLILQQGDVDYSNVGIPSQADLMIGVGFDATFEAESLRNFTLCKNKISGDHSNFPVRMVPQLSRMIRV